MASSSRNPIPRSAAKEMIGFDSVVISLQGEAHDRLFTELKTIFKREAEAKSSSLFTTNKFKIDKNYSIEVNLSKDHHEQIDSIDIIDQASSMRWHLTQAMVSDATVLLICPNDAPRANRVQNSITAFERKHGALSKQSAFPLIARNDPHQQLSTGNPYPVINTPLLRTASAERLALRDLISLLDNILTAIPALKAKVDKNNVIANVFGGNRDLARLVNAYSMFHPENKTTTPGTSSAPSTSYKPTR